MRNESLLLLDLYRWAEGITNELPGDMTPAEWMHLRVDHIVAAVARSEKDERRKHLRQV